MLKKIENLTAGIRLAVVLIAVFVMVFVIFMTPLLPSVAYADMNIGGHEIQTWGPQDLAGTGDDIEVSNETVDDALHKARDIAVMVTSKLVIVAAIGAAFVLIWTGFRNIFVEESKRVSMFKLLKNFVVNFFFMIFGWVLIELLLYGISNGGVILFYTIF